MDTYINRYNIVNETEYAIHSINLLSVVVRAVLSGCNYCEGSLVSAGVLVRNLIALWAVPIVPLDNYLVHHDAIGVAVPKCNPFFLMCQVFVVTSRIHKNNMKQLPTVD